MAGTQSNVGRFTLLIVGLLVAGGLLLWMLSRRSASPTIPVMVQVQPSDTAGFEGYVLGVDSAPVTIVEYADYQCPACQTFDMVEFPYVKDRLVATGKARFVFKDFPLDQPHRWARLAAHAAACTNEQNRFWEMKDEIFRTQPEWSFSNRAGSIFRDLAGGIGVDLQAYDACMQSLRYAGRIQATLDEGVRMGVNSTPTLIVGGQMFRGAAAYDQIRAVVDSLIGTP